MICGIHKKCSKIKTFIGFFKNDCRSLNKIKKGPLFKAKKKVLLVIG